MQNKSGTYRNLSNSHWVGGISQSLNHMLEDNLEEANYNGSVSMSPTLSPAENNNSGFENLQYFYHSDHLGSSSFVTNRLGRVVQHLQYLPFGEVFINQRSTDFDSPYKFTAKEHDPETNYTYFGARYYDSDASILMSVDPMASEYPSLSPYVYCANNPIKYIDPDGQRFIDANENRVRVRVKRDGTISYKFAEGTPAEKYYKLFNDYVKFRYDYREKKNQQLDKTIFQNRNVIQPELNRSNTKRLKELSQ